MPLAALDLVLYEVRLDLRRGGTIRTAPVVIMAVTLFVLGMFLVVTANLKRGIAVAQGKVEMVVFIRDDSPEMVAALQSDLARISGVREVRFVARDEALQRFRHDLGDNQRLLDEVNSNPLPASFEVAIYDDHKSEERLARIAAEVGALPEVDGIRYGRDWVGKLQRLIVFSALLNLFLGVILGVSTVLSVANTLRLALEERRESIEVRRLIGASDGMIRGPIVIEGWMLGTLAALAASASLYGCCRLLAARIPELVFMGPGMLAGFVIAGGLLGVVGSHVALGRILRDPATR